MSEPDLFSLPDLPYAGTSGFSGTTTSEGRAREADKTGKTKDRQRRVMWFLAGCRSHGATWKELSEATGWHHGTASGALSVLHKTGRIARLSQSRHKCKVYVLPNYVDGRETEPHRGSIQRRASNPREAVMLTEHQADVLIQGHDTLVNQVSRTIADQTDTDTREQAERVIEAVADWLSSYRPPEIGGEYCTPLDVTAFILRKGELKS